jgi:NADH dehydrogenase
LKRIIIIGAGFAGLRLARKLKKHKLEIWLIDKNNYHQFQPLFYQVATAGLEPSSISFPLRKLFRGYKNVHVRRAEVTSVDTSERLVFTSIGSLRYDYLVIATGAGNNFFGNDQIEKYAMPMKSVSEALYMRNHILENFENALIAEGEEKKALLNFVIVGGGPTGVEISGALAEMKRRILPKDYPELNFSAMNIYLIESEGKTLSALSEEASTKSQEYLKKLGVLVYTSTRVTAYDGNVVSLSTGKTIPSKNLVWAAGIKGNLPQGLPKDVVVHGNRIAVNRFHQVNGFENIFAIGDISQMVTEKYPKGHPQVATVANEHADSLAKNLKLMLNQKPMVPFEYKDKGSLATVGRHLAIVELPFAKFYGYFAWLFWMFLHLMLILGAKNKLFVFVNWLWKYFSFDLSLRLIIKPSKK